MSIPPKSNELQFFQSKNLLKNPGWENGKDGKWTASAGTYTVTSTAADIGSGARAGSWDAAADEDTLTSNSHTITGENGYMSRNGVASVLMKCDTGTCTHTLDVYDGTNIIATTNLTSVTTGFTRTSLSFVIPSSGTIALRIKAEANEPLAFFDDAYLGLAEGFNLANLSQAEFAGSAYIAGTANCTAITRTNTALGAFTADADCPGPTVEFQNLGSWQTTDADLPKFTVNSLPPGKYMAIATFQGAGSGAVIHNYIISDGTTTSGLGVGAVATTGAQVTLIGHFNYSSTANRTFEIYGSAVSGTVTIPNDNTGNDRITFALYKFPSVQETAYKPEELNWLVDASISGGHFDLGASDITSPTGMTHASMTLSNNTSSTITAQIPCSTTTESSGTTCTAANESNGISFVLPRAGKIRVCTSIHHSTDAGDSAATGYIEAGFRIVQTGNADQTVALTGDDQSTSLQQVVNGVGRRIIGHTMTNCSNFNMTSAGKKTFRLFVEQEVTATVSSSQVHCNQTANAYDRTCHWTVEPIDVITPAPVLVSGNSTTYDNGYGVKIKNPSGKAYEHCSWPTQGIVSDADNYTILTTDHCKLIDSTDRNRCVYTLPEADTAANIGLIYFFIKSASTSGDMQIKPQTGDFINGVVNGTYE